MLGNFTGGGALGTATASFGARVAADMNGGSRLSLRTADVYSQIATLATSYSVRPFAAAVLFNTRQTPVSAATLTPSFSQRPYGIAKFTLNDVEGSPALIARELARAGLSFEYERTLPGFEEQNVRTMDSLSALLQRDSSWGTWASSIPSWTSVYLIKLSDILANNGNDNVSTQRYPATVSTAGYTQPDYAYESGLLFGRGVWHMPGANLLDDNTVVRGTDDGFAFAHSPSQQRVIDLAFGTGAARPNDRLVNSGPANGWPSAYGPTTYVMLFDADKNHHFQPTTSYTVQVGWYERQWRVCRVGLYSYACYDDVWRTAETNVSSSPRTLDLPLMSTSAGALVAQRILCEIGVQEVSSSTGAFQLCEQNLSAATEAVRPAVKLNVPFQDVAIPASNWDQTYYWRFATSNGSVRSAFTAWSAIQRTR